MINLPESDFVASMKVYRASKGPKPYYLSVIVFTNSCSCYWAHIQGSFFPIYSSDRGFIIHLLGHFFNQKMYWKPQRKHCEGMNIKSDIELSLESLVILYRWRYVNKHTDTHTQDWM